MPATVTIRRATIEDAETLAGLAGELGYPTTPTQMRLRLEVTTRSSHHAVFVAEQDSVVGWIQVSVVMSLETGDSAEIRGLVVAEGHRSRGVGRLLVETAEAWARERGFGRIRVRSNVVRERTLQFYRRLGYQPAKRQEVFDKLLPDANIRAIFWDNDGVLVDTEELYFQATREVLASAGVTLTTAMFVELFMVQGRGAWHLLEATGASPATVAQMRDRRNARYEELLTQQPIIIDGVHEVLEELSGKYLMGVVTSSHRAHFDIIHRRSGMLKYFAFVLAREDYGRSKPDPEPYRCAIARSGLRKEECLVVEDTERGLASATAAGLRCVVVPRPMTSHCRFDGAYRVLRTLRELPPLLAQHLTGK